MNQTIVHAVLLVLCTIVLTMVVMVMADGGSVIVLKTGDIPTVTNPAIVSADLRLIAGEGYGVGLVTDTNGKFWTDVDPRYGTLPELLVKYGPGTVLGMIPELITENAVKHPTQFLQCQRMQDAGITALSIGIIGTLVTATLIIVHLAALACKLGKTNKFVMYHLKYFCLLCYIVSMVGFLVVVLIGLNLYDSIWYCDNPVVPALLLSESFDLNYGIPFAITGMVIAGFEVVWTIFFMKSVD